MDRRTQLVEILAAPPLEVFDSFPYSSCIPSKQAWIPPRHILDPETEKMTGGYTIKYGDGGCSQDDLIVTENVHSVLTDGTFLP